MAEIKEVKKGGERKRKKHVSKKSKRSWRKNTDIKDIEEHLDEVRRQERLGGVISLKKDAQLFFVDKETSDTEDDKTTGEFPQKRLGYTRSSSKVYHEAYIKPITARKRQIKQHKKRVNSDESSDDENKNIKRKISEPENSEKPQKNYDIWETQDVKKPCVIDEYYLRATKKLPVKQPDTAYKVRGKATAVSVCHPGASYNPTFEDHQSLLATACQIEILKEKELTKIQARLKLPSQEELAKLPTWEEEMSEGLFEQENNDVDNEQEEGEEGSDGEEQQLPVTKITSRISKKEKRKKLERRNKELTSDLLRKEKAKEHEVFRVKSIKKELRKAADRTKQRQAKKSLKEQEAAMKPQRLGKLKFEEMNIEIQLTDELSGSLRKLKPEGNLYEERYKSFQRRNIIEPRKPVVPHRRYAMKEYQKRSYKNYDLHEKIKEKRKKL